MEPNCDKRHRLLANATQVGPAHADPREGTWWLGCGDPGENSLEGSSVASTCERLSPADFSLSAFAVGLSAKQHNLYKVGNAVPRTASWPHYVGALLMGLCVG